MSDVRVTVKDGKLVIELPYTEPAKAELSKSGKTKIVAGTGGFQFADGEGNEGVPTGLMVSVNAVVKV